MFGKAESVQSCFRRWSKSGLCVRLWEHLRGMLGEDREGSFRYCQLGEPLLDEAGKIRESVSFADLAPHVLLTERR